MALTQDQITAQNFADFYATIKPYLNGGGFGMKKLWENPSPSTSFAGGDITLSSSDYDMLLTLFDLVVPNNLIKSCITRKGDHTLLDGIDRAVEKHTYVRSTTAKTDTVLTFTAGYYDGSVMNTACVPVAIYGIKLYSYDNISCVMMSSTWEAGETTVEFTDPIIDGDSIFDVYLPSQYADLIYSSLSVSGHTLTITFPSAQASDIEVKLRVNRG